MNIGLVQMAPEHSKCADEDLVERNINRAFELVEQLMEQGSLDLVVFPEFVFTGPISTLKDLDSMVKDKVEDDIAIKALRAKAKELGIAFVAPYWLRSDGKIFNCCALIDKKGEVLSEYSKVHLYPPEFKHLTGGSSLQITSLPLDEGRVRIGLQVCYDLMFPEACRALALQGAELIIYPTMCEDWLMDSFEPIARARAIENQVYVVLVNSVGHHPRAGGKLSGRSLVATPEGEVFSLGEGENVKLFNLNLEKITEVREKISFISGRCPLSYGGLFDCKG